MLAFANFLEEKHVTYSIHKYSDDAITVFFTIVGARIEVEFNNSEATYSVFRGNEDVLDDQGALFRMIEDFVAN